MEAGRNKRQRLGSDDPPFNFSGSKLLRLDSGELNLISPDRDHSDPAKQDLLKILEEADAVIDRDSAIPDLDSVMRSFEEEIQVPLPVLQPDLGYLLEASDDELGLPPPGSNGGIEAEAEAVNFGVEFEDEVSDHYCWMKNELNREEEEVVALGGLFDLIDDTAELLPSPPLPYRSETMYCL